MKDEKTIFYKYTFVFEDGSKKYIQLNLDAETLDLIQDENLEKPEWAKHNNFLCPMECLRKNASPYCSIALNINHIIRLFSDWPSFQKVKVSVETNTRTYFKETSLQVGIGSLFGIIMPTCGCPTLGKLKPLVKHHLPFANIEETEFRVFSMYLLAQYLLMKLNKKPDWGMDNLKQLYEDIQNINRNIARRIADLEKLDASINSVIVLNNFADSVTFSIEENLEAFERLFNSWLTE
jgi:hypothetical protein